MIDWEKIRKIKEAVPEAAPLIHCITNPISIHDCANVVLAAGARPIMAEHPEEVREITATAKALGLNLGNITDARRTSILLSGEEAMRRKIPVVLDMVGIGCSHLRRKIVQEFLEMRKRNGQQDGTGLILKGNFSEIRTLACMAAGEEFSVSGVDVRPEDTLGSALTEQMEMLAKQYHAVLLATGKTDVITDGAQTFYVENGSDRMARITGTGCMLTALTAAYLSMGEPLLAAVLAAVEFGVCGELATEDWKGTGTYQVRLLDELSSCGWETIWKYKRLCSCLQGTL